MYIYTHTCVSVYKKYFVCKWVYVCVYVHGCVYVKKTDECVYLSTHTCTHIYCAFIRIVDGDGDRLWGIKLGVHRSRETHIPLHIYLLSYRVIFFTMLFSEQLFQSLYFPSYNLFMGWTEIIRTSPFSCPSEQ